MPILPTASKLPSLAISDQPSLKLRDPFGGASLPNRSTLWNNRINQLTRILDGKTYCSITTDFGHISITKELLGYSVEHSSATGIKTVYLLNLTGQLITSPKANNGSHRTPLYHFIDEVLSTAAQEAASLGSMTSH